MTFFYDLNKKLKEVLDAPKSVHQNLNEGAVAEAGYSAKDARAGKDIGKPGKNFEKIAKKAGEKYGSKERGEKVAGAVLNKLRHPKEDVEEGLGSVVQKIGKGVKKVASKALDTLGHGSDEDLIKDLQKKVGMPQTGKKPMAVPRTPIANEEYGPLEEKEGGVPMTPKQKKFAKLAPPADKITFADKIAGAKQEVDEMLGDVAADAIKKAITHKGGEVTRSGGVTKHKAGAGVYGGSEKETHALDRIKGPSKKKLTGRQETDEGWDDMMKDVERRREKKTGEVERGHKHDIKHTATGRVVTRRTDDQGISVGADDNEKPAGEKRGRGRPKKTDKAPERVTANAYKHKGGRKMTKESASEDDLAVLERLMDEAFAEGKNALGNEIQGIIEKLRGGEEELEEKAVSKKQQKFMGMVHAAQKGEKPASKEVAKVAKSMGKKDAKDFAATKHKGLPEKKKKKEEVEETTTSGSVAPSTAAPAAKGKGGMSFGKGIYDSMNRELEQMIAESMNISMNMTNDSMGGPSKSLTVTATDEDALYLGKLLKMAGVGGDEGGCGCGTEPCSCGSNAEVVDENSPDWPTDEVESNDALQYAGGLNKPKTTVAGDGQTTVPVTAVQVREEADEELDEQEQVMASESDELKRIREMAGIKEAAKPDYIDLDKDGDKKESMKKAAADKEGKKVEESILQMTNLWKAYKG